MLTKLDQKILRYLYPDPKKVSLSKLQKHFHKCPDRFEYLRYLGYIQRDYEIPLENGIRSGSVPGSAMYFLTDQGVCEVESHQWFDGHYIFSSIMVPIIVGVASSVITALLLALLT